MKKSTNTTTRRYDVYRRVVPFSLAKAKAVFYLKAHQVKKHQYFPLRESWTHIGGGRQCACVFPAVNNSAFACKKFLQAKDEKHNAQTSRRKASGQSGHCVLPLFLLRAVDQNQREAEKQRKPPVRWFFCLRLHCKAAHCVSSLKANPFRLITYIYWQNSTIASSVYLFINLNCIWKNTVFAFSLISLEATKGISGHVSVLSRNDFLCRPCKNWLIVMFASWHSVPNLVYTPPRGHIFSWQIGHCDFSNPLLHINTAWSILFQSNYPCG